jgi:hypothetical protein
MPKVQDASMVTTFRRVNATITPDPTNKSRTYVAPIRQGFLISQTRASETTRWQSNSVLALPRWTSLPFYSGRVFVN